MNTVIYYIPNSIIAYSFTCNDDMLETYKNQLIENGAYKIFLNNELIYNEE